MSAATRYTPLEPEEPPLLKRIYRRFDYLTACGALTLGMTASSGGLMFVASRDLPDTLGWKLFGGGILLMTLSLSRIAYLRSRARTR